MRYSRLPHLRFITQSNVPVFALDSSPLLPGYMTVVVTLTGAKGFEAA